MTEVVPNKRAQRQPHRGYWYRLGWRLADTWPLFVCGAGIGFLTGLSISPGISATVNSVLLCLTAALAAVMSGFRPLSSNKKTSSPSPTGGIAAILAGLRVSGPNAMGVMLLIVGVVLGACAGVYFRTHNSLGVDQVPAQQNEGKKGDAPGVDARFHGSTLLFDNLSPRDKERLRGVSKSTVVAIASESEDQTVRRFAVVFKDDPDQLLRIIREVLLWEPKSSP